MTELLLWLLALSLIGGGLAGCIYPLIPGLPLMLGGVWLAAWIGDYQAIGSVSLTVVAVLVVIGLLLDFVAGMLGARRVRASREAVIGAMLGSIAGLFFGLPGLILGPFIGAVAGELKMRTGVSRAMDVGVATWVGLLFGALAKLAIGLTILGIFLFALVL